MGMVTEKGRIFVVRIIRLRFMKKICSLFIILLLTLHLYAAGEGESSFYFLDIPQSSHINGLGGNNISIIENDLSVVAHNPALLGAEMDGQFVLSYLNYVADIDMMGFAFAKRASDYGAFSFGMNYLDYGDFTSADEVGNITGTFTAKDILAYVSYSHDMSERWRGGVSAKFIYSVYEQYTSVALAVDAGVNYYNPYKQLSFSALVKNMGGVLKQFTDEETSLPFDVQLGLSKTLDHAPFRVSVTAQHLTSWSLPYTAIDDTGISYLSSETEMSVVDDFTTNLFRHLVLGIDYIPSNNFYIALGYNYKTRTDMSVYNRNFISGFTVGAGINVKMFGIHASMYQHHVGGTTLMFNLTTELSAFMK